MKHEFSDLKNKTELYSENKDCTVKATAVLLGISYEKAWNFMQSRGREARKGFRFNSLFFDFEKLGLFINPTRVAAKTVKSFSRTAYRKDATLIIFTAGHVLIYKDGKVRDWSADRQARITDVFSVSGDVDHFQLDHFPDMLQPDLMNHRILSKPIRKRQTSYCWKLVRNDTGETVKRYKRKPTSVARNIHNMYLKSAPHVSLSLHRI